MLEIKIKLDDRSRRAIDKFPRAFQDALVPAFEKIMLKAEGKSKEKYFKTGTKSSPVDQKLVTTRSGNLRRIISNEVKEQGNKIYASLTADIEYAATHEYGDPSRNIGIRSFLTPAIEDTIQDASFEDIIINEINKRTQF